MTHSDNSEFPTHDDKNKEHESMNGITLESVLHLGLQWSGKSDIHQINILLRLT